MPWSDVPEKPQDRKVIGFSGSVIPPRVNKSVEGWPQRLLTKWVKDVGLSGSGSLVVTRAERYAKAMVFSGNGGLVVASAFPVFTPVTTQVTVAGAFNYTIPWWATKVDVILLGGGAGASGGVGAFVAGVEGHAGQWVGRTLVRGVDFTAGATTLAGFVGAAGVGGPGAVANTGQIYGTPGGDTYVNGAGMPAAAGGEAANAIGDVGNGWTSGGAGASPGNFVFNTITYTGGAVQNTNGGNGNAPGGGGKGGAGGLASGSRGGNGSIGRAWFRAWQ